MDTSDGARGPINNLFKIYCNKYYKIIYFSPDRYCNGHVIPMNFLLAIGHGKDTLAVAKKGDLQPLRNRVSPMNRMNRLSNLN